MTLDYKMRRMDSSGSMAFEVLGRDRKKDESEAGLSLTCLKGANYKQKFDSFLHTVNSKLWK